MKRKGYLILGILILMCIPMCIGREEREADNLIAHNIVLSANNHYDKTISPGNSWYLKWLISGEFDIDISYTTTGNDITFYFVTEANWVKWMNYEAFYYIDKDEDVYAGGYSGRFSDGTWYLVFSNRDALLSTTTLSLDVVTNEVVITPVLPPSDPYIPPDPDTTTRPSTTTVNPIYLLLANPLVWFIGLICGIGFIVKRHRGKKKKEITEAESKIMVLKDATVFVICPYCGAKTEQGITKCQKCGADL